MRLTLATIFITLSHYQCEGGDTESPTPAIPTERVSAAVFEGHVAFRTISYHVQCFAITRLRI
jgi:hypothetical protein